MNRHLLHFTRITDAGDARGSSFTLPDAARVLGGSVKDLHIMTLRPRCVRGNHFHAEKHERILVIHADKWSVHWDSGPDTEIVHRTISGKGALLIRVEPHASHAIRNDGDADLWIVAWSDREFDTEHPDVHPRAVI